MLLETLVKGSSRFVYAYDMGDDWEHDVVVEKIEDAADDELACLDGRRSRPPEDGGGPPGFESLVTVLADPKHPEHDEMKEWVGPYWNAEHFDLDFINKELRKLGARWRKRPAPKTARPRALKRATD